MKPLSLCFLGFAFLGMMLFQSACGLQGESIGILHVTVVDTTDGNPVVDQTVVIKGNRIIDVGKTGEVFIPNGASIIDASGKFLIPGLWDMHVHTLQGDRPKLFFPLLIANGVTGIRDMGVPLAELELVRTLRNKIEAGEILGPRIIAGGPLVDGPSPMFPALSIAVSNETEGTQVVEDLQNMGADFIKVYSLLPRDAYFAVATEAKRRNIPFVGHVPESVSAFEASDTGQKSIEHLSGVRLACSTAETELRKELLHARLSSDPSLLFRALRKIYTRSNRSYSQKKASALFARFVANDTWQVPTLVVARFVAQFKPVPEPNYDTIASTNDRELKQANPAVLTTDEFESVSTSSQNAFDLVMAMRRVGVKFMAGTDAPNPFVTPGESLHQELELLVQAGFTPLEALQCATRNPAQYLGRPDVPGKIEAGKLADLVLLDANPLEDIRNTRKIWAVIVNGKLLPRRQLDEMLIREGN